MPHATAVPAARAIWEQMRSLRDDGVTAQELTRAQRVFESRWLRHLDSMEGQATHLAEWEALGAWQLGDRYYERVTGAAPDSISDAIRRYLTPERAGWVVYRPIAGAPVAADASEAERLLDMDRAAPLAPTTAVVATVRQAGFAPLPLEREEGGVRIYRTANGVPVLVRRRPGTPIAHVGVYALGGAASEPTELVGLSTLIVRTSLKGTDTRTATALAEESEMLGAVIGTSATADGVGWTISVPVPRVSAAIDLLADVVQNPTFPEAALETERRVALANVAQQRDDMYRHPVRLAMQAAYGTHPYARSVLGTEETLGSISVDAVRSWHRDRILRAPSVIAVVGDVDPDEIAAHLGAAMAAVIPGNAEPIAPPRWPQQTSVLAESRDKAQTALVVAFEGPSRREASRFATSLTAGIASGLGGRFFDELRDRQSLAYTVQAYASERLLAGTFISYIATSPDREEVARRGLLAEFAKLRDDEVTLDELERAKTYAIGTRAIRQENGSAVLGDLVDAWLYGSGLHEIDEHDMHIRAVTPAEVRDVARRYFVEDRRVEGVVRGVVKTV
jgi:zinc protease